MGPLDDLSTDRLGEAATGAIFVTVLGALAIGLAFGVRSYRQALADARARSGHDPKAALEPGRTIVRGAVRAEGDDPVVVTTPPVGVRASALLFRFIGATVTVRPFAIETEHGLVEVEASPQTIVFDVAPALEQPFEIPVSTRSFAEPDEIVAHRLPHPAAAVIRPGDHVEVAGVLRRELAPNASSGFRDAATETWILAAEGHAKLLISKRPIRAVEGAIKTWRAALGIAFPIALATTAWTLIRGVPRGLPIIDLFWLAGALLFFFLPLAYAALAVETSGAPP